ncbi:MAG: 3-oxoacyl-(acyl-carrier-protein) reductase [Anaerocolumna sp.]|jgi:3-oxoacyl-[acyl-carrier protein] reductase|nr:3-oxoacyl-(acyl-carrier-protein) reductase [Anaerocolumna sp.]
MLENKVALVTGGSRGIGRAISISLASNGALVVVNYCGSKEKADEVVKEITVNGGRAVAYQADITDANAVKSMFDYIMNEFKSLDILINNAGITKDNLILKMTEEEFDQVINTNLRGVFSCLKQASRIMLKQKRGSILNLSSVSGIHGNPGQVNYSAAKAGVVGMTKTLAKELGSRGITVNAIAPGYIKTDMTDVLKAELKDKIAEAVPLKRLGNPEDIAEMATFLVSPKASYITGQVIEIDGGLGL